MGGFRRRPANARIVRPPETWLQTAWPFAVLVQYGWGQLLAVLLARHVIPR